MGRYCVLTRGELPLMDNSGRPHCTLNGNHSVVRYKNRSLLLSISSPQIRFLFGSRQIIYWKRKQQDLHFDLDLTLESVDIHSGMNSQSKEAGENDLDSVFISPELLVLEINALNERQ